MQKNFAPPPNNLVGPKVMCLAKNIRHKFNDVCNEQGLFSGQQDIVIALNNNPGMTVSQLAKMLNVSNASASVSVKRMEKAGFITKKADEKDARITCLYPTEKSQKAPEFIKQKMDAFEEKITQGMSEGDIKMLNSLLDKAIKNMSNGGDNNA